MHRCRRCQWMLRVNWATHSYCYSTRKTCLFRRKFCQQQSARSSFDEQLAAKCMSVVLWGKIGQNANGIWKFLKQLLIVPRSLKRYLALFSDIYNSQATFLTNRTKHFFVCCDFEQIRLIYCETFRFSFTTILNSSFYVYIQHRKVNAVHPWEH